MVELTKNKVKWTLFIAMSLTLPTVYFALAVGGTVSLFSIIAYTAIFPIYNSNMHGLIYIGLFHCVIYALIFYGISARITFFVMKKDNKKRMLFLSCILTILFIISFFPIYGITSLAGHSSSNYGNLYKNYGDILNSLIY